jgi:5-methylcytosine-specific restriction endonuclease McrA
MKTENSRCLVLNNDYSPLSIIDWKKAIVWSMKYHEGSGRGVDIIDFYKNDYILCTNNKKYPIPAVVKTRKYFKLYHHYVNFSRKNLFIRDDYTCQYCSKRYDIAQLTYDHVIPKSLWQNPSFSPTNWTNIVTACVSCNRKKGNKTPQSANMPLKNPPKIPHKTQKFLPVSGLLLNIRSDIPLEWSVYLPEFCT